MRPGTPVVHALDQLTTGLDHLVKLVEDGGLDHYDDPGLVGFLQGFEKVRKWLPLVDHAGVVAVEARDLPQTLCQGSVRRVLTSALRISKAEAARRVRGGRGGRAQGLDAGAKLKALLDPLAQPRICPPRQSEPVAEGSVFINPGPLHDIDIRHYGQRLHDALEELCDRLLNAGDTVPSGGVPATLIVTIDLDDLLAKCGYGRTADGTLLPTKTVLAMANNAEIIPAVLNSAGKVLDLGRSRRIASHTQTLALTARDGGCSFPGCDRAPQWCERHHIREWVDGGETNLDNLTLLCRYHHHNFASRGWHCRINGDGLPEWTPPAWADRSRTALINTRIQGGFAARRHARRGEPIRM